MKCLCEKQFAQDGNTPSETVVCENDSVIEPAFAHVTIDDVQSHFINLKPMFLFKNCFI